MSFVKYFISTVFRGIRRSSLSNREYKSQAWQSPKMALTYRDNVELRFFTSVTWPYINSLLPPSPTKILDAGAGTGRLTSFLADHYSDSRDTEIIALDISKAMLDQIPKAPQIQTLQGSIFDLPFDDRTFDLALSLDVMAHFEDWRLILAEYTRVVTPGSKIIFNYIPQEHVDVLADILPSGSRTRAYSEQYANIVDRSSECVS